MKKIIALIALIVAPIAINAQSYFDTLEDMEGVDVVVVNKDMFVLLSKFDSEKMKDNEAMQIFSMIKNLNSLKVFSTDNNVIADKMDAMANSAIKEQNLTQLMRIKEDDSRIKIYVKSTKNKDYVSEVLMFIKGVNKKTDKAAESVIVSLTGNIDINKISDLADTFTKDKK